MKYGLFLILILISTSAFAANAKTKCDEDSTYPHISKAELTTVSAEKTAFIVDVNGKESYDTAHVPGAIHFAAKEKQFAELLPKDKNALIVAYCGNEKCTAWKKAAKKACEMGYTNIKHYNEGIKGWTATN